MFKQEEWLKRPETQISLFLHELTDEKIDNEEIPEDEDDVGYKYRDIYLHGTCSLGCHGLDKQENEQGFVITLENGKAYKVLVSEIEDGE